MPSRHLSAISDRDLLAVITYLRTIPPIDREPRTVRIGWLTRMAIVMGAADDIFSAGNAAPPRPSAEGQRQDATPEYGRYLVEIGNCRICHHADLQGGLHPLALPGEPPPPSLRGATAMRDWGLRDFAKAMRTGETPDGRLLDREYMPWPSFAALADLELEALWFYLSDARVEAESDGELARVH